MAANINGPGETRMYSSTDKRRRRHRAGSHVDGQHHDGGHSRPTSNPNLTSPTPQRSPNFYVDATGGDDGDDGTIGTPWQTLSKVLGTQMSPGDTVYFKRGETWTEHDLWSAKHSGTAGTPVTWDAYGSGAKPIIDGTGGTDYIIYMDVSGATNKGDLTFKNLDFRNGTLRGIVLNWFTGLITFDTCDFSGCGDGGAVGKPGMLGPGNNSGGGLVTGCTFTSLSNDGVYLWNSPGFEFDACTFSGIDGTTSDCIQFTGDTGNYSAAWHVHDCDFDMTGTDSPKGCVISENGVGGTFEDNTTAGGIFGLSSNTDDVVCQDNIMSNHDGETYAGGFYCDPQTRDVDGMIVRRNVMIDCNYGIAIHADAGHEFTGALIEHNTIIDPVARGIHIEAPFDGTIQDNIVEGTPSDVMLRLASVASGGTVAIDYNVYHGGTAFYYGGTAYASFAAYQSGASQDAHSLTSDPLLDATYHLHVASPAIDAAHDGSDIGYEPGSYWGIKPSATTVIVM